MKGAINPPLIGDLTFQETSGVHLDKSFEALPCGPELGLFPMACQRGKGDPRGSREEVEGLRDVVVAM